MAPWPDALRQLRDDGFLVIGLSPCASAPPLRQVVATAPARVAFVAGHEGEGLTSAAMRACTVLARIPMAPGEDSVNVATAVAIALYEVSEKTGRAETAEGTGSHGGTGETGDERRSRSKE
jgi:tRNA G18 (ribose-2'-O)-methylase SpoU